MTSKDYFAILGLSRQATPDQIKQAYREKARLYHPDLNAAEDANERFQEVVEAYEVLSDPAKRAEYLVSTLRKKPANSNSPWTRRSKAKSSAAYWTIIALMLLGLSLFGWALEGWREVLGVALQAEETSCSVVEWQQTSSETFRMSYTAQVPWQAEPFLSWRDFDTLETDSFPVGDNFICYYNVQWQAAQLTRYETSDILRYVPRAIWGLLIMLAGAYWWLH